MSKSAKVLLDSNHAPVGLWQSVIADDWTVSGDGVLSLRVNGEPVAQFQYWVAVKWATEEQQPEFTPLVDIIGEKARRQQ